MFQILFYVHKDLLENNYWAIENFSFFFKEFQNKNVEKKQKKINCWCDWTEHLRNVCLCDKQHTKKRVFSGTIVNAI